MLISKISSIFSSLRAVIILNRYNSFRTLYKCTEDDRDPSLDDILNEDSAYHNLADSFFHLGETQNCYIIQPYVKWGPEKLKDITPTEQIEEAKALVYSINSWNVVGTITVPLENLQKHTLFGSGSLDKLKKIIRTDNKITSVFINKSTLKKAQVSTLQTEFGVPIFDRYKIVMQILRNHAHSKHAKLQVSMAELHYLERNLGSTSLFSASDPETVKAMFQAREKKIKTAIQHLRDQRGLLRKKRNIQEYPTVAVVGYTNAGKTSLIKALTGEEKLQPRNQLFATLDVTTHQGLLPSGLKVLYVDTVGFISDIPTNLIECFVATLEDAVFADVILHVEDLSSQCFEHKRKHVMSTLCLLARTMDGQNISDKIINVGNKCDLTGNNVEGLIPVSSKSELGLDNLRYVLEKAILKATSRTHMVIKVPSGGDEIRWLYKNATIIAEVPDETNQQIVKVNIIITNANLNKFKHHFI